MTAEFAGRAADRGQASATASGVLNTIQELGAVIAGASVGALLQNRLATALHDRAVESAGQIPIQFRDRFVQAFGSAAKGGLEIGAGQTGGSFSIPPGVRADVVHELMQLAHSTFSLAFVDAVRPTLVLPIAVILGAALLTLVAARRRPRPVPGPAPEREPVTVS